MVWKTFGVQMNRMLSVVLGFAVLVTAGCGEVTECDPCGDSCPTLSQALDRYNELVNCCSGLNLPDDRAQWETCWRHVPAAWVLECVSRVQCTDGPTTCSDRNDPITWGDQEEMDTCIVARRQVESVWCDGDWLKMCALGGGSSAVDCDVLCGSASATCVEDDSGQATCTCGFPVGATVPGCVR